MAKKKQMKRLQGKDWHDIKRDVEVLGYYEDAKTKRIKVFTKLLGGPIILYHWLNETERAKFENHKHKYPQMNDNADVTVPVRR